MYNETYECKHYKYTINIPIGMMQQAKVKAREQGFLELAPYFRAILAKEMQEGKVKAEDIFGEKEVSQREYRIRQRRDIPRYSFVRLSIKNFLDKVKSTQYTLW